MNVVSVHAPNTLPYIYERGLFGVYHDWCESFGTYPRSYDLLHADHLFSRLKNRYDSCLSLVSSINIRKRFAAATAISRPVQKNPTHCVRVLFF